MGCGGRGGGGCGGVIEDERWGCCVFRCRRGSCEEIECMFVIEMEKWLYTLHDDLFATCRLPTVIISLAKEYVSR